MTSKTIKAIECIFDWNLWPRHEAGDLDSTNLKKMKCALLAGVKLPPIILNKKDNRIVDGFHRVQAVLSLYGDGADIKVEFVNFKNDAEMFLESARLNNQHGLPLSPRDRVYVIVKARRFKIPMPVIAEMLGLNKDEAMAFLEKRTAKSKSGETIILSGGAMNLAGKVLTKKQEYYVKHTPGNTAQSYATILLNSLDGDMIIYTEKIIETLKKLQKKIEKVLLEVE